MIVCVCQRVNDREFFRAIERGCTDLESLQEELGVALECKSCEKFIERIVRDAVDRGAPHGL